MVHRDDGKTTARRQIAGQVHQAVDVDEIERGRSQQMQEALATGTRIVQVRRIDPPEHGAPQVIPRIPEPAVLLGDGKHVDGREPAQSVATGGDISDRAVAECRRALEAERADVERASEETQDVVRPDPHSPVRWVGQRLAEEKKARPRGQIAHRALQA